MKRRHRSLEWYFERLLWGSRLLVLVAVAAGMVLAGGVLLISVAFYVIGISSGRAKDPDEPASDR